MEDSSSAWVPGIPVTHEGDLGDSLAPGFSLTIMDFWGENQWIVHICVCVCVSLSFF